MNRLLMLVGIVAVVASACGGDSEPVVTLGNGVCEYDGPSDFDRGTIVSFRIINESSEDGGFAVLQLVGAPTFDEFAQELPSPEYATVHTFEGGLAPGSETEFSVGFTATGNFGVVCLSDPFGTNRVIAGALLEVDQ